MRIERFEDIIAWQKAKELSVSVYSVFKDNKDYSFRDQIRRASVSIMNNIAEGFEREGRLEFNQFLSIAKGSLGETKSQLYRSYDRKYISEDVLNKFVPAVEDLSRRIFNTMEYLKNSDIRGIKYKSQVNEAYEIYANES